MDRRQFLSTATVGALVWTVPTVLTVEPADAATRHSGPPTHPQPERAPEPAPEPVEGPEAQRPLPQNPTGQLPYTGGNETRDLIIGTAVTAAGAALIAKNHEPRPTT